MNLPINLSLEIVAKLPLDEGLFGKGGKTACKIVYMPSGLVTDVIPNGGNGFNYLSPEQRHYLRTEAEKYMENLKRIEEKYLFFEVHEGVRNLRVFSGKGLPLWKKIKLRGANTIYMPQNYGDLDQFEIQPGMKENGSFTEEGYRGITVKGKFAESLRKALERKYFKEPVGREFYNSVYRCWESMKRGIE